MLNFQLAPAPWTVRDLRPTGQMQNIEMDLEEQLSGRMGEECKAIVTFVRPGRGGQPTDALLAGDLWTANCDGLSCGLRPGALGARGACNNGRGARIILQARLLNSRPYGRRALTYDVFTVQSL